MNANLKKYIDEQSFFTKDLIYKIGVMHKELPVKEKNWAELASYLKYEGTGNALRCFVNGRLKKEGKLHLSFENNISAENETTTTTESEYQELYKERTRIRDIYNSYRLSLRQEARLDSFKDNLIAAIKELKPIELPTLSEINGNCEAVLMLSDLHLGVICDNFYNVYNYQIAQKRLNKLANDTIYYCIKLNVYKINVINLGDMIQGLIHTSARIDQEFNVIDQIIKAAELISNFLSILSLAGFNITYRSCTDNHSRLNADKSLNIEEENFNKIIDWYIESRLEKTPISFIHDNLDNSLGRFTLDNNKIVMYAHGHLENVNKCVDAFSGATKKFVDYVLLSHYHASREKSYNGSKLFVNGSIVGTEQYALSKRLFGNAEQKLLIFSNDNVLDININLQ